MGVWACCFQDLIKRENIDVDFDVEARPKKRRRVIGKGSGEGDLEVEGEVDAEEMLKEASEDVVRMEHAYVVSLFSFLNSFSSWFCFLFSSFVLSASFVAFFFV